MIGTRVDIPFVSGNPLNQEKIGLMKRLLSYLQTLLLVCLMAGNAMAQDDSPNRDVSELAVEDLRTFDELKRHMSIGMRAYTKRYRACLLYTSPSPRDKRQSRMPSSA